MKNKGFTLIELLAVIVILAVIVLIAIPVMLNVINKAKLGSLKDSAYGMLESANLYYAQYKPESNIRFDINDNKVTSDETANLLKYEGNIESGTLILDKTGKTTLCITDGTNSAYKNYTEREITVVEKNKCYIPDNRTVVYLEGAGATRSELTNQELTDELAEIKAQLALKANQSDLDTTNNNLEIVSTVASSSTLDKVYPIGSIYISTSNTNPSVLFGGTWEAYGTGRTLVGVDASQTEFNTVNKTGGEKTHTLTVSEIPSHTHTRGTMNITGKTNAFGHNSNISYGLNLRGSNMTGAFYSYSSTNSYNFKNTSTETLLNNTQGDSGFGFDASKSWTGETSAVGGSGTHNNLQPYITVYMYKRVG